MSLKSKKVKIMKIYKKNEDDKKSVLYKLNLYKNNRMLRSSSKSSLGKKSLNDKYFTDHNKLLLHKIDTTL